MAGGVGGVAGRYHMAYQYSADVALAAKSMAKKAHAAKALKYGNDAENIAKVTKMKTYRWRSAAAKISKGSLISRRRRGGGEAIFNGNGEKAAAKAKPERKLGGVSAITAMSWR
jgi:hypothetical protein